MPDLPKPTDTSIATAPSEEANLGSTTHTGAPASSDRNSLTIGPDERLYAAGADGKITRFELGPDGRPNNAKIIQTITTSNRAARTITGICFDPASTRDDLRLWVSHGQSVSPTKREVEGAGVR